jgi:hypothetical protein
MKKNHFRMLTLAAMLSVTISLSAQVRIGGGKPVTPGALLDMNSVNKGTMLFPHVSIDDLDKISTSIGAHPDSLDVNYNLAGSIIFNTNSTIGVGLYLWDGNYWVKINTAARPDPYAYCSTLYAAPDDNTGKTAQLIFGNAIGDTLTFLTYNLGADPDMTPFEQMKYSKANSAKILYDIRVNGGLFQWGRKDFTHAIHCPKEAGNAAMFSAENTQLNYPTDPDDGKFVWGASLNRLDWVTVKQDNLWDSGKPGYTGDEDPCPSGFHVPAYSQWNTFANNSKICWISVNGGLSTQRYVAIPVQNGIWNSSFPSNVPQDSYGNYPANCGFAIYTRDAYDALITKGDGIDLTAPTSFNGPLHEPVLFLPTGGIRDYEGVLYEAGSSSSYWSSTVGDDRRARRLFLNSRIVEILYTSDRAAGMIVRCVKE